MELQYSIEPGYTTKEPIRGTVHSAGMDIYTPEITSQFCKDLYEKNKTQARKSFIHGGEDETYSVTERDLYIMPHARIIIPTGLRFLIPEGTYLEVANRGSVASQQGLIYGAHIVDEDYISPVFINLINTTDNTIYLKPGTRIAQLLHKEYIKSTLKKVDISTFLNLPVRGSLGSTGIH